MRTLILALFFCASMALGRSLMNKTWDGVVYLYISNEYRAPANVRDINNYYPVDGHILTGSAETQALENMVFVQRDNEMGIRLGHFLTWDSQGRRQFACQVQNRPGIYDRVQLAFMGVGVAEDGKVPKMTIDSACASEDDIAHLSAIWIPMSDIYQSEPKAQELHFPEIGGTALHFEDLASSWPNRWTLVRVRFYNSNSGVPDLLIEPPKTSERFSFDWQPQN